MRLQDLKPKFNPISEDCIVLWNIFHICVNYFRNESIFIIIQKADSDCRKNLVIPVNPVFSACGQRTENLPFLLAAGISVRTVEHFQILGMLLQVFVEIMQNL